MVLYACRRRRRTCRGCKHNSWWKPDAGNPHVRFDERGYGNVVRVEIKTPTKGESHRKQWPPLNQKLYAPALDSTPITSSSATFAILNLTLSSPHCYQNARKKRRRTIWTGPHISSCQLRQWLLKEDCSWNRAFHCGAESIPTNSVRISQIYDAFKNSIRKFRSGTLQMF